MQQKIILRLLPSEAADDLTIRNYLAIHAGVQSSSITGYNFLKKSIDARGRKPWINLTLEVFIDEPWRRTIRREFHFKDVRNAKHRVLIIGAGPAGLFAALELIEHGIKPIILERGKDVRNRRRDLAALNKEGEINPDSNYCFGEGGAGTYSDGKLYTRSTKRGDIDKILQLFVHFGADEKILYESHPHIGTNKLPAIITAMRTQVLACGGECHFENRVTGLELQNGKIAFVKTGNGLVWQGDAIILATGHSARDIFQLFHEKKIHIEFKPFALGVRVEHPQELIDCIQYHCNKPIADDPLLSGLPPASYSLVQQVDDKGVFSFCMCPGGIIAPAATDAGELVVNGWSPSKRNNPFANSGIVTPVEESDVQSFKKHGSLSGMYFQQQVERKAFEAGGGKFSAPAQRLVDFTQHKLSPSLPKCSYLPGTRPALLNEVLPSFVFYRLQKAFIEFGKKMPGYFTNDAIVVATESRTSSPVRIPRDPVSLHHIHVSNIYPCGEGAGYAGGIVSAAMDGQKVAVMVYRKLSGQ